MPTPTSLRRRIVSRAAAVSLLAGALVAAGSGISSDPASPSTVSVSDAVQTRTGVAPFAPRTAGSGAAGMPKVGRVVKPERLPAGYVGAGSARDWHFLFQGGGRWNPCKPIRWSYNPAGQRYGRALADVSRAFAKISGVSGLRFKYVGRTTYRYLGVRSEKRFPSTRTDMVISWASPKAMPAWPGPSSASAAPAVT